MARNIIITESQFKRLIAEAVSTQVGAFPSFSEWRRGIDNELRQAPKKNVFHIGEYTFVDKTGHATGHLGITLLKEVLKRIDLSQINNNGLLEQTIVFPKPVGYNECVETSDTDDVIYSRRMGRSGKTRFVLGRQPEPCNTVFIMLKAMPYTKGCFKIVTAYVGKKSGREPWDEWADDSDNEFWKSHALISPEPLTKDNDLGDVGYWRKSSLS